MRPRILLVDDDEHLLAGLRARLRKRYDVAIAVGALEGLDVIAREAPFPVVVSDYRMPEMNGAEFLARVGDLSPQAVRIMLTGTSDTAHTIEAVNRGNLFRLLSKPCSIETLTLAIDGALEQFEMVQLREAHRHEIECQNARYDELLHALFPGAVVAELQAGGRFEPRRHEDVAVLFCDVIGFTSYCDKREPEHVVDSLQELVEAFEDVCVQTGVEKTKTIGDAFMATAGLLTVRENPVLDCVRAGLGMIAAAREMGDGWSVRVGIHIGPVVAGIIGRRQYLFDVWGDTVNTAARVEHCGVEGSVTLTEAAWQHVSEQIRGRALGPVSLKGKGSLELFAVDAIR